MVALGQKIIEHDQASLWTQPAALTTNIASYFILREGPPGDAACPPLEWSEMPALMTGPGVLHPEPSSFFRIKSTTALLDGDAVVSHAAQMYPIAPRFFAFETMILASGRTRIDLFIDFANCSSMRAIEPWAYSTLSIGSCRASPGERQIISRGPGLQIPMITTQAKAAADLCSNAPGSPLWRF
jgi:hypothetical protein